MNIVVNAFFARQEGHTEFDEVVDLLEEHGLLLLAKTLEHAGV